MVLVPQRVCRPRHQLLALYDAFLLARVLAAQDWVSDSAVAVSPNLSPNARDGRWMEDRKMRWRQVFCASSFPEMWTAVHWGRSSSLD